MKSAITFEMTSLFERRKGGGPGRAAAAAIALAPAVGATVAVARGAEIDGPAGAWFLIGFFERA